MEGNHGFGPYGKASSLLITSHPNHGSIPTPHHGCLWVFLIPGKALRGGIKALWAAVGGENSKSVLQCMGFR